MANFDAVIFDLDETLTNGFDSETGEYVDIHFLTWKQVMDDLNFDLTLDLYHTKIRSKANYRIDAWFAEEYGVDYKVSEIKEPFYINESIPKLLSFLPNVQSTLTTFAEMGLKLGLVTNAPRAGMLASAEHIGLWSYIDEDNALSLDDALDLGLLAKPDPRGLLEVASRLGVEPERAVYVGDARSDMRAASAAGMFGVGVVSATPADELSEAGAQATVEDLSELFHTLGLGQ